MKIWRAKRCPPKIYKHFFVEPDKLNAIRETAMDDKHCYRSSPDMANAKKVQTFGFRSILITFFHFSQF